MGATINVGDIARLRAITPDYRIHTFRGLPNICFRFKRNHMPSVASRPDPTAGILDIRAGVVKPQLGPFVGSPKALSELGGGSRHAATGDFDIIEIPFVLDRYFRTAEASRENKLGTYNAAILKAAMELSEKSYFSEYFGEGWQLVLRGARDRLEATNQQPMNKISVGMVRAANLEPSTDEYDQLELFHSPKKPPLKRNVALKSFLQINLSRLAFFETTVGDGSTNRDAWGPGKVSGTVNLFDEDFRFNIGHPYHPIKDTISEEEILRCIRLELDQNFPWILKHELFRNIRFD
ncbi:MAG: hypothetical protein P4L77_11560 [Sulfuriferula sp.]|nr:hypothetical protein [Sulfuriferula sp.]